MVKVIKSALLLGLMAVSQSPAAWETLPDAPPVPADNPTTQAKVELGRMLYFDPRLSIDGTVSCNSCHNVMTGGTDNRPVSVGVKGQKGGRSAPTVFNAAFLSAQFWDGRAATLEDQAKGPILNPIEMGMPSEEAVLERLRSIPGYVERFAQVFGGGDPLTYDNVARAIAAYERTLITPGSPYDRYVKGDKRAMTEAQVRGMETFASVGCTSCHSGPLFSGPRMPMGEGFYAKFPVYTDNAYVRKYRLDEDPGRYQVTGKEADKHMWKVPTLRNIALTAPYFHNGSVKDLDEAVRVMAKVQLNKTLSERQVQDIVAFLGALTGTFPEMSMPRLPATPGTTLVME